MAATLTGSVPADKPGGQHHSPYARCGESDLHRNGARRLPPAPASSRPPVVSSRPRGSCRWGPAARIRHLASDDVERLGAEVILANTYHLMLRPGAEVVASLGGLHGFAGWDGHFLTDSGGYQIFSLEPELDDGGATFTSTYDGSTHVLTPERAAEVQALIGADIQMVLDVCPSSVADASVLRSAVDRTALWAQRGRRTFLDHPDAADRQCQFGIVQGGTDALLRAESAERTVALDFDGYAVGGLSVGEDRGEMLHGLDACMGLLPADQPRYFMGLGDPVGIVESVARGVDMFDCVLPHPPRPARHDPHRLRPLQPHAGRVHRRRRATRSRLAAEPRRPLVTGVSPPPPHHQRAHGRADHHPPQRRVGCCDSWIA